jgi:hypothetical protein
MKHLFYTAFLIACCLFLGTVNAVVGQQNDAVQVYGAVSPSWTEEHAEPLREYLPGTGNSIQLPAERAAFAPPPNDLASQAIGLVVNASCTNGVLDQGTTESWEPLTPCNATPFMFTVWYRFVANASTMYVQLNTAGFAGNGASWIPGNWGSIVYRANTLSPLSLTQISCKTTNSQGTSDGIMIHTLSGLTVNTTYYVQVGYATGTGANLIPNFCIKVGSQFTPNCNACTSPCGSACGFTAAPTVTQVTSTCYAYNQSPYLEGAVADTQCYTFYTSGTTASFNVIVNSTCGTGNVSNFSWYLYASGCGAPVQTGTLSNLSFTGLTANRQYTFCYSFTVPTGCYHTAYWPYFVGVQPLPVKLVRFDGEACKEGVCLNWTTATEVNNEKFIIEKSFDGLEFRKAGDVAGHGTTSEQHDYSFTDANTFSPIAYYRLIQFDWDGHSDTSEVIAVRSLTHHLTAWISPNPSHALPKLNVQNTVDGRIAEIAISDMMGNQVQHLTTPLTQGLNTLEVTSSPLPVGYYFISLYSEEDIIVQRLVVVD